VSEVTHARHRHRPPVQAVLAETRAHAAEGELRMSDMEYGAAAHPHQMCVDTEISAQAYRVWGVMDFLKRNRIPPKPEIIADLLDVTERSIERWIAELHNARWLVWNKNAADPWRRYELRQNNSEEEIILAQIRALFASGEATIEAITRIVQNDRDVGSDTGVGSDTDVGSDRNVETGDPTITRFDRSVETGDPTITRSDTTITSDSHAWQQDAPKGKSPSHDGGGVLSFRKRRSPTTTISGARVTSPTVTEIWLRAEGVSKKKSFQFRDFPIDAIQAEWNAEIPRKGSVAEEQRQQRIGRLLDRWEVRPPSLAVPSAISQCDPLEEQRQRLWSDAYQRACALLGRGAPWQDMAIVINAIVEGASDDQALDALAAALRQAQEPRSAS